MCAFVFEKLHIYVVCITSEFPHNYVHVYRKLSAFHYFTLSTVPLSVNTYILYMRQLIYIQKRIWNENDLSASCHFINEQPIHHSLCMANVKVKAEENGKKL